jgi:hypothetical protein
MYQSVFSLIRVAEAILHQCAKTFVSVAEVQNDWYLWRLTLSCSCEGLLDSS